ncbi:MAG TPA: HAMP domain-containing sensor histidine kinase [Gemmatimonadales bacterium]|nr:HAMP domain-containing sensor histidine kinase [Gemmatimonadales bacterium]
MQPLSRLRLQLTAWYAAVFTLVLALLGAGLFLTIRHQMSRHVDKSLRAAAAALEQAARIRETERDSARGAVVDAVDELHIPDRSLYLVDENERPIKPAEAPDWVLEATHKAVRSKHGYGSLEAPDGRELRIYAGRFTGTTGTPYIAAVVADRMELEDEYTSLIETFAAAALAALLLVAGGGYLLIRKSTAPVERSMDQMRRFMADAAHELRTPITILRTRAEVALGQGRDVVRDGATFRDMERETARLGEIVGDLLTLARADAGERPVGRMPLYLDDVAAEAVDAVRPLAEQKSVQLEVGAFDEARIAGDPALVRQLLLIVLDNAVKFTGTGGHVRLDVAADNGRATAVVADTGVGIPPEQLPHVFERFYRGDPARREADGAGLGLAIARWIADTHNARIDISSTPGTGTRVTVSFPVVPELPGGAMTEGRSPMRG